MVNLILGFLGFKKNHNFLKKGFVFNNMYLGFLVSGFFGIKAMERGIVTYKQLEVLRRSLIYKTKKGGLLKLRVRPYFFLTTKGIGDRMGAGVGSRDYSVFKVRAGQYIVEISGISRSNSFSIFRVCSSKLSFKVILVSRFF